MHLLRGAEAVTLPVSQEWCGGRVTSSSGGGDTGADTLHFMLHSSSFPDVEITNLTVGVSGWARSAGHVAVVTAHADGEYTLASGSPRSVTADTITVALTDPPPIREGRTLLTLRLEGGARLRTLVDAPRIGTVNDGGLALTLGVCSLGAAPVVPCVPALLSVSYDAECAKAPKEHILHDSLRVSRLGSSDVHIMADRMVPELRRLYHLSADDDLIVEMTRFELWMGVVPHRGAMRLDYEVRSAEPRERLGADQLRGLARKLAVSTVSRRSTSPFLRLVAVAAMLLVAVAGAAALIPAVSQRIKYSGRKRSVQVVGSYGVYEKSLVL
jgi:hypothetical protein